MNPYRIFTDSACDIAPAVLKDWGVECVALQFHQERDGQTLPAGDLSIGEFYQNMRAGSIYKTSAANIADFTTAFAPVLEAGEDVLYLAFSSGLSTTANAARIAAEELMDQHPSRRVVVVDTLCASAGQGLLVWLTVQEKASGASLTEAAAFASRNVANLCHWFTVDDLVYLRRGGRVSAVSALLGGALNIKPVLHVDDEGHLIAKVKVRGRRQSIQTLADKYAELALDPAQGSYFISHADCLADAQALAQMIEEKHGCPCTRITNIGPVVGSHSGPGTLALFFLGQHR